MEPDSLLFSFFLIFSGAALLSTFALAFRQPLLVAYIGVGVIVGPYGIGLVSEARLDRVLEMGGALLDLAQLGEEAGDPVQDVSVLVAIRENEQRARFLGYSTYRYTLLGFVVSASVVDAQPAEQPTRISTTSRRMPAH